MTVSKGFRKWLLQLLPLNEPFSLLFLLSSICFYIFFIFFFFGCVELMLLTTQSVCKSAGLRKTYCHLSKVKSKSSRILVFFFLANDSNYLFWNTPQGKNDIIKRSSKWWGSLKYYCGVVRILFMFLFTLLIVSYVNEQKENI